MNLSSKILTATFALLIIISSLTLLADGFSLRDASNCPNVDTCNYCGIPEWRHLVFTQTATLYGPDDCDVLIEWNWPYEESHPDDNPLLNFVCYYTVDGTICNSGYERQCATCESFVMYNLQPSKSPYVNYTDSCGHFQTFVITEDCSSVAPTKAPTTTVPTTTTVESTSEAPATTTTVETTTEAPTTTTAVETTTDAPATTTKAVETTTEAPATTTKAAETTTEAPTASITVPGSAETNSPATTAGPTPGGAASSTVGGQTTTPTTEGAIDSTTDGGPTPGGETDQSTVEGPTLGGATDQSTDGGPTPGGATELSTIDGPTPGGETDQSTVEGPTLGGATDQSTDDGPTELSTVDGPTAGGPTDQSTDGGATDQSTDGEATDQSTDGGATDQSTDGGATELSTVDGPTAGGATDQSTDGGPTELSTVDGPTAGGATDQSTDDGPTELSTVEGPTPSGETVQSTVGGTTNGGPTELSTVDGVTPGQATATSTVGGGGGTTSSSGCGSNEFCTACDTSVNVWSEPIINQRGITVDEDLCDVVLTWDADLEEPFDPRLTFNCIYAATGGYCDETALIRCASCETATLHNIKPSLSPFIQYGDNCGFADEFWIAQDCGTLGTTTEKTVDCPNPQTCQGCPDGLPSPSFSITGEVVEGLCDVTISWSWNSDPDLTTQNPRLTFQCVYGTTGSFCQDSVEQACGTCGQVVFQNVIEEEDPFINFSTTCGGVGRLQIGSVCQNPESSNGTIYWEHY